MNRPLVGMTMNAVCAHEKMRPSTFGSHYLNFSYTSAIVQAGGIPVAIPFGPTKNIDPILKNLRRIVVTGGKDIDPAVYGQEPQQECGPFISEKSLWERELVLAADELDLPLLGICLGMQLVNVARGGTLYQDVPTAKPSDVNHPYPLEKRRIECHTVFVQPESKLAHIFGSGKIPVNSLHHQGIDQLGKGLSIVARAEDGLIEAIEDKQRSFLLAVQWHPEDLQHIPRHQALFNAFIEACREP